MDTETEDQYHLKSLLSVIADSGQVEVYILDKNDIGYIPDMYLRLVFEKIAALKEPDRPLEWGQIEEIKEEMIKWEQFKVQCVRKMFREKAMEANNQLR